MAGIQYSIPLKPGQQNGPVPSAFRLAGTAPESADPYNHAAIFFVRMNGADAP